MRPPASAAVQRALLLVLFAALASITLQRWIGNATIYSPEFEARRLMLHQAVLTNQLPPGASSWSSLGANGIDVRVATVMAASRLSAATGIPVLRVYRAIDTVCLVLAFILLYRWLRRRAAPAYAVIGMLYFGAMLPLTYFLHAFHPWDRASLVCWLALLLLLTEQRIWQFALVLVVSMTVKYDTLLLPGLYFLIHVGRRQLARTVVITAGLFAVSFGVYAALRSLIPHGFESRPLALVIGRNLSDIRQMHVGYPPLLMFLLPAALSLSVLRSADREERACVLFAAGLTLLLFVQTNFAEVRAELPILLLLLPSALRALRGILEGEARGTAAAASA